MLLALSGVHEDEDDLPCATSRVHLVWIMSDRMAHIQTSRSQLGSREHRKDTALTENNIDRTTGDWDRVDLVGGPGRRPIRVLQALEEEVEVVESIRCQHRQNVERRDQVRGPHRECSSGILLAEAAAQR